MFGPILHFQICIFTKTTYWKMIFYSKSGKSCGEIIFYFPRNLTQIRNRVWRWYCNFRFRGPISLKLQSLLDLDISNSPHQFHCNRQIIFRVTELVAPLSVPTIYCRYRQFRKREPWLRPTWGIFFSPGNKGEIGERSETRRFWRFWIPWNHIFL